MILVDTDALIHSLRRGEMKGDSISLITLLEYLRGLPREKREEAKRLLEESFEVIWPDNEIVLEYCRLYDALREEGRLMGDADLLIGATAIAKGMRLLTKNRKHFERLLKHGLTLHEG